MRSLQTLRSTHDHRSWVSSACLAPSGTAADWSSVCLSFTLSTFLRPFAPRALPRFRATMDALSSVAERLFGFVSMNTVSGPQQTSLLNAPHLPAVRSPTTPRCPRLTDLLSSPGLTARVSSHPVPGLLASWASPFSSRLATATGRIEFVNLPTSSSPPVAPHAASRRRSYLRLSRPGLAPSEDFHLTDSVRSQAHWSRGFPARRKEPRTAPSRAELFERP